MEFCIEHVAKSFEKKRVLKDIDFVFEEGRIYGLLGRNGAGTEIKSGMYKVVTALTYVVCYEMIQIKIPTFVFGMAAIGFSMLYCVAACVLVYKIAPKTFKLRA